MKFIEYFNRITRRIELGSSLFFHEDDFCQIELLPDENLIVASIQCKEIKEFSETHFNGIGYTDVYVRPEKAIQLNVRKISPFELEKSILQCGFSKARQVLSGYGQSYRVIPRNTEGFGKDYSAIFFGYEEGIVTNIWMTHPWNMDRNKLSSFLMEVGEKRKLILVDREATTTVDLNDNDSITNYLS